MPAGYQASSVEESDCEWSLTDADVRLLLDDLRYADAAEGVPVEQVAQACTRYQAVADDLDGDAAIEHPDFWSVVLAHSQEWCADELRVRQTILRLIDLAPTDDDLEFIGIDFMELGFFADEARLRWAEEQAAVSDRFRRTIRGLWVWGDLLERAFERLERAAGTPLPRPRQYQVGSTLTSAS